MSQRPRGEAKALNSDVSTRIEAVATRLFILHGYNGVSYLDIAREMGITHSSIHYYHRSKVNLAETVLRHVADETLDAMKRIWADPATTLFDKFVATRDWIHGRYLLFNPQGKGGQPWGLLARFTADAEALTAPMRRLIRSSVDRLEGHIATGVEAEWRRGGLAADAPRNGITLQIASLMSIAGQVTRHSSGFERLDALMRWTYAAIDRAYSREPNTRVWPELPPVRQNAPAFDDAEALAS